jgi:hypothetical protein
MGQPQQEVHQAGHHPGHESHPDQLQQAEHQATQAFQSCVNDARVLMAGGFNGMVKDAQKEWKEHPLQLVGEVAVGAGVGFGIGVLAAAASPLEAAALTTAGGVAACGVAWDQLVNKAERNEKVMHALMDAAKPGQSEAQIQKDQRIIEQQLGADIFHGALAVGSSGIGGAAGYMAKTAEMNGMKEAMNAFFRAHPENNKVSNELFRDAQKDYNALRQVEGQMGAKLKPQPSLKFEPNTRPPQTPQGLHHIVIDGREGH